MHVGIVLRWRVGQYRAPFAETYMRLAEQVSGPRPGPLHFLPTIQSAPSVSSCTHDHDRPNLNAAQLLTCHYTQSNPHLAPPTAPLPQNGDYQDLDYDYDRDHDDNELNMNETPTLQHLNDYVSALQSIIVGDDDDSVAEMQRIIDEEPSPIDKEQLRRYANVRIRRVFHWIRLLNSSAYRLTHVRDLVAL